MEENQRKNLIKITDEELLALTALFAVNFAVNLLVITFFYPYPIIFLIPLSALTVFNFMASGAAFFEWNKRQIIAQQNQGEENE